MSGTAWLALAAFVVAYVLIATERIHRVAAALGCAVAMLLIGATDAEHAFFSPDFGIDWNVLFLLLGMMLIVAVVKRTGVFECVAIYAAKRASGRPFRLMVVLVVVTATASALLDNVTTVLLLAPATITVCERLAVPVAPFLIAEVMASNIGGTATLIGDPPNVIIAGRAGLSFNDFLMHLAPIAGLLVVVFLGLCRIMFASALRCHPQRDLQLTGLRGRDAIRNKRLLIVSGVVVVVVLLGFALHRLLHLEPAVVAMVGGLVLLAASRLDVNEVARDVEWPTLVFFAGLFVMVGALVNTGLIPELGRIAVEATGDDLWGISTALLGTSAGVSAIVDNIPYVAATSPIVADLVSAAGGLDQGGVLWWALALGAGLGGNATAIGASANVVVLCIAERAGHPISFWRFTRYGLIVTAITVVVAGAYVWLRYFAMAGL